MAGPTATTSGTATPAGAALPPEVRTPAATDAGEDTAAGATGTAADAEATGTAADDQVTDEPAPAGNPADAADGAEQRPAAADDDEVADAARAGGDRHEAVAEETVTFRLPAQMSGEDAERIAAGHATEHATDRATDSAADHRSDLATDHGAGQDDGPDAGADGQGTTDPYAIGPERHERVADEAEAEPVTDKGLPKRTPKVVSAPAPRPRTGAVDADALRRRLGGFHTGSRAGRRDVEAELAGSTGGPGAQGAPGPQGEGRGDATGAPGPRQGNASEQAMGGTVEEASS